MSFKLYLEELEEIVYETGIQEYNVDKAGTKEITFNFDHQNFNGFYKEINLENLRVSYGKAKFFNKTTLLFEFNEETIEMHFTLSGKSLTKIDSYKDDLNYSSNTHNIFYGGYLKGSIDWLSEDMFIFEVNMKPDFFKKNLPSSSLFDEFKNLIDHKKTCVICPKNYPITQEMCNIIYDIIHCQWKNQYKQLYINSKIMELLILQLSQIENYSTDILHFENSNTIQDKMYNAKEIITNRLEDPISLFDLAKMVNTNECTLKKEFKKTFGNTVFGFIREIKMEQAKVLLEEKKLSINEISELIGYKNPQHFSTAFKNKYGISPTTCKKGMNKSIPL